MVLVRFKAKRCCSGAGSLRLGRQLWLLLLLLIWWWQSFRTTRLVCPLPAHPLDSRRASPCVPFSPRLAPVPAAAFDNRTTSAREFWRQMQATRYRKMNPRLEINTHVLGSASPPEIVLKLIDDTEVGWLCVCLFVRLFVCSILLLARSIAWFDALTDCPASGVLCCADLICAACYPQKRYDSRNYTASEIFFDVHLSLDNLDNEFELSGKSLDD